MSRKRRQRGNTTDDLISELASNEVATSEFGGFSGDSASDIADFGYSSTVGHDDKFAQMSSREKILRKSIEEIYPNLMQPRRAIPSSIRHYFTASDVESMAHSFDLWLKEVEVECGGTFPLTDYLDGKETKRVAGIDKADDILEQVGSGEKMGPLESALMEVVELAASIKRDGLTNPISLARRGSVYDIETGERRWLAYHLLNWQEQNANETWQKIPARLVDDGVSIWRQANENNIRADLNAIATARQFALLLMDILVTEKQATFATFDAFEQEQDFYAQVADGRMYAIPANQGEKLINAMGISDVGQLRHLRRLLRLPNPVWVVADDLNWSESFIQKTVLRNAAEDEEKIRRTLLQARAEHYDHVSVLTPYQHLLAESAPKSKAPGPKYSRKHFSKTLGAKVEKYLTKLSGKERAETIADLRDMLDALEAE